MKVQDFKDMIVWQRAKELTMLVYEGTRQYPKAEQFGLTSQVRRAAVSIVSNIAEGYARQHTREYIQSLYTSLGSAAELETQMIVSFGLGYLKGETFTNIMDKVKEVQKMLNGLIRSLEPRTCAC